MFHNAKNTSSPESIAYKLVKQTNEEITSFANECDPVKLEKTVKFITKKLIPMHDKGFAMLEKLFIEKIGASSQEEAKNLLMQIAKEGNLDCVTKDLGMEAMFDKRKSDLLFVASMPARRNAVVDSAKKYAAARNEYDDIVRVLGIIRPISENRNPHEQRHERSCVLL